MTKLRDKAKNGYVKITLDREEFWADPKELKIDDKTFDELKKEHDNLLTEFENFTNNTNLTITAILKKQKALTGELAQTRKALQDFIAEVIRGGE